MDSVRKNQNNTGVMYVKHSYTWKITERNSKSPSFPVSENSDEFKWYLEHDETVPKSNRSCGSSTSQQSSANSDIVLVCEKIGTYYNSSAPIEIKIKFLIDGQTVKVMEEKNYFSQEPPELIMAFNQPLNLSRNCEFVCDLLIPTNNFFNLLQSLADNFENIYKNKLMSDVTLQTSEGKKFKAHKLILSARSPVFYQMFNYEKEEEKQSIKQFPDVDTEVMKALLQYIYCGKVEISDNILTDVMIAANEYQLDELKNLCEKRILNNLTKHNIADIIVLADRHNARLLKTGAIRFLVRKARNVISSTEFQSTMEPHKELYKEICLEFARKESPRASRLSSSSSSDDDSDSDTPKRRRI